MMYHIPDVLTADQVAEYARLLAQDDGARYVLDYRMV